MGRIQYKDKVTIILPKGGKSVLYKSLSVLGIKQSEGIREILVAFYEGRCTIQPGTDKLANLFENNKGDKNE